MSVSAQAFSCFEARAAALAISGRCPPTSPGHARSTRPSVPAALTTGPDWRKEHLARPIPRLPRGSPQAALRASAARTRARSSESGGPSSSSPSTVAGIVRGKRTEGHVAHRPTRSVEDDNPPNQHLLDGFPRGPVALRHRCCENLFDLVGHAAIDGFGCRHPLIRSAQPLLNAGN